jgi:hypothetical protein
LLVAATGHALPTVSVPGATSRNGWATIAAGRASTGPLGPTTVTRLILGRVGSWSTMLASVVVMSSSERSHEPALAVTSKQPVLSVTIAIGSSPMLIAFLPGVSGSASSTRNTLVGKSLTCCADAPSANSVSAGFDGQVVSATVPDADCRMNPYQSGGSGSPWLTGIPTCPG